jgi:aryl-alcohol dehydrogenase-like predicted oxidoreductase
MEAACSSARSVATGRSSVVGDGAWAMGGPWQIGWAPRTTTSRSPPCTAHSTWTSTGIDTAAAYGLGRSEEVVGQVVRKHGDGLLVFTKCGRPWYGRDNNQPTYDLRPDMSTSTSFTRQTT